ncbi:MAG: transcriptional regulator [Candidatus Thiodiazotropha sp. (ex Ctena orbiculata)]|nr:transcriptional regulator [Candidatus Thiodiazotropha taylori]
MPFCHITLKAEKSNSYPSLEDCYTLGDHIKRTRLKRGLRQIDVAPRLGVNPWTLRNWELNRTEPCVQYYPAIMVFLGYCPYQRRDTLGTQIMLHRTHKGLSQRQLAQLLKVDPGSISRWETGIRYPIKGIIIKLLDVFGERFLKYEQYSSDR